MATYVMLTRISSDFGRLAHALGELERKATESICAPSPEVKTRLCCLGNSQTFELEREIINCYSVVLPSKCSLSASASSRV
jgi:hypothetical protein